MCLCLSVDKLKDRLASVSAVIPVLLPRALRLISSAAPGLAIAWVTTLLIQGALPALTLALTRTLVDRLVTLLAAPLAASYLPVVLPALALARCTWRPRSCSRCSPGCTPPNRKASASGNGPHPGQIFPGRLQLLRDARAAR
jgi:hypothetical protein